MAEQSNKLNLAVAAYRLMQNRSWQDYECLGDIEKTPENLQLYEKLDSAQLLYAAVQCSLSSSSRLINLHLQPPRNNNEFFAKDISDLLSKIAYQHECPASFYIADQDCQWPSNLPVSGITDKYLSVLRFIKLLRSFADYEDKSTGFLRLVFLHKEKLEVQVTYSDEDLVDLPLLNELEKLLHQDVHKEQLKAIFKSVLLETLKQFSPDQRFKKALQEIKVITSRSIDNYQLYVSEFSFEKVYKEINEKRLDYILKLNKNFSDMQNQLLAVPLATLLASSQIVYKGGAIRNGMVWVVTIIFSAFMSMLLRNQRSSLYAIKQEIDQVKTTLHNDHPALETRFEDIYNDLCSRCTNHSKLLYAVDFAVAVTLVIIPTILLYWYTKPSIDRVLSKILFP